MFFIMAEIHKILIRADLFLNPGSVILSTLERRLPMPYLYVLLSRSDTWFSGLIYRLTPGEFTHAALAVDRDLRDLYSFGRHNPYLALPAGFVTENVHAGIYGRCGGSTCRVYRVAVTERDYRRTVRLLDYMKRHASNYHYNLFGTVLCVLRISRSRRAKFFCSEFVSEMLQRSGAVRLPKPASLMRPGDLAALPEAELIYEGPLRESDRTWFLPALDTV